MDRSGFDEPHQPLQASPSPSFQAGPMRTSCDQCRHAKIKCERPDFQSCCAHCMARGTPCVTTPIRKKSHVKKITRHGNILGIESRIARMESLLASSGIDTASFSDGGSTESPSEQEDISTRLSTLIVDDQSGTSHFWGPSSCLSLFSPQGLQWVAQGTGTDELQGFIAELAKSRSPDASAKLSDLWSPIPSNERFRLPPRAEADRYIRRWFGSLNSVIPLFDQESFTQMYEQQYSSNPPDGPAWYAALNIVFAIGSLTEAFGERESTSTLSMDNSHQEVESPTYRQYFKNACCTFIQLAFTSHSILAVQALLGICFILECTLDVQAAYVVLAAAARLAHTIGLHRRIVCPEKHGLSAAANKERRNVFWILYTLETSMAIRFGRPPVINDDDVDVPLPERGEYVGESSTEDDKLDAFYHQVTLSRIENKIYAELYSVRSQKKTVGERLKSIAYLDQKLQAWCNGLPPKVRPGQPLSCPPDQIAQAIILHFVYYNCITILHRAPSHCALWTMNPSASNSFSGFDAETHHRVYASHMHCINAARSTGQLIGYFDQQERLPQTVLIRLGIFYPLCAFLTLFANILQNPKDSYVEADNRLMNIIANFFSVGLMDHQDTPLELAGKLFQKLSSITTQFLAKTDPQKRAPKRGYEDAQDAPSVLTGNSANSNSFVEQDMLLPQQAAISDDMGFQTYGQDNFDHSVAQDQFVLTYDPADPGFANAHRPPQISPFMSLDLGNIEWDSILFL